MAEPDQVSFKNKDLREMIEAEKPEDESLASYTQELVKVGLRETKYPIMYRLKDIVVQFSGMLAAAALVILTVGLITNDIVEFRFTLKVSLTLLAFALFFISFYEAARAMNGQSELGTSIWRLRQ